MHTKTTYRIFIWARDKLSFQIAWHTFFRWNIRWRYAGAGGCGSRRRERTIPLHNEWEWLNIADTFSSERVETIYSAHISYVKCRAARKRDAAYETTNLSLPLFHFRSIFQPLVLLWISMFLSVSASHLSGFGGSNKIYFDSAGHSRDWSLICRTEKLLQPSIELHVNEWKITMCNELWINKLIESDLRIQLIYSIPLG